MMKISLRFVLILFWVVGLVSCGQKKVAEKKGAIVVKGSMENADGKVVELVKASGRKTVKLDQDTIEGGRFVLAADTSKFNEPAVLMLQIPNSPDRLFLFAEPDTEIEITAKNSLQGAEVKSASPTVTGFAGYLKELNQFRNKEMQLQQAYTTARQKQDQQEMDRVEKEYFALQDEKTRLAYKFIEKNKDNYTSALILSDLSFNQDADAKKLKELYDKLSPEVKKSSMAQDALQRIELNLKTAIGMKAPDFEAPTPDGKTLKMSDVLKNSKVLILDFWASWCKPCRRENPYVVEIYKKYHSKGLEILGVSLDKPGAREAWLKAIKDDGLTWKHVSHLQYWQDPVARLYGVQSIPSTFILDKDGVIRAKNLRREKLEAKIKELLNE